MREVGGRRGLLGGHGGEMEMVEVVLEIQRGQEKKHI